MKGSCKQMGKLYNLNKAFMWNKYFDWQIIRESVDGVNR